MGRGVAVHIGAQLIGFQALSATLCCPQRKAERDSDLGFGGSTNSGGSSSTKELPLVLPDPF